MKNRFLKNDILATLAMQLFARTQSSLSMNMTQEVADNGQYLSFRWSLFSKLAESGTTPPTELSFRSKMEYRFQRIVIFKETVGAFGKIVLRYACGGMPTETVKPGSVSRSISRSNREIPQLMSDSILLVTLYVYRTGLTGMLGNRFGW
jgi:hypothetical protein